MKKTKKFVSFIMAVVILFSGIATFPVTALDNESTVTTENDDLTVSGTNSTGNLIANALSDVQAEQEENNGYNVFSATVEDNAVLLEVETLEDCTVVVGIYDEAGTKLITSGYTPITTEDKTAIVVLETEEMPQYFYLRAFLVDSNTFRPICKAYDCPNYTQEMQEFLAKTTEDFETDRVVNFDDSVDNNFAVYDESTIVIPEDSTGNDVASVDDETGVYVIENADESITSLVAGDIFAYEYEDGNILIVKVAEITIDGTTATIKGEETTLEEVFEYVKIDSTAGIENAEIDTSTLEEGMEYKGKIEKENDDTPSTYAVDVEGSISQAFSYEFFKKDFAGSEEKEVSFSADLTLEMEVSVKVYISLSHFYIELKLEPTLELSGKVTGKWTGEIPLGKITIPVAAGVKVTANLKFIFEVSGEIEFSAKLETTIGMGIYKDEGFKDLTSKPKVEFDIEAEVEIFLGIRMEAGLVAVSKRVAEATLGGQLGVTATISNNEAEDAIHLCNLCLKADVDFGVSFDVTVSLLNGKLEWKEEISFNVNIGKYYFSGLEKKIKKGYCPHIYYKTIIEVVDDFGEPVKGATVHLNMYTLADGVDATKVKDATQMAEKSTHTTNSKGQVVGYLSNGTYVASASKTNYSTGNKKFTVKDATKNVKINMKSMMELPVSSNLKMVALDKFPVTVNLAFLNLFFMNNAVITNDGSLYVWGSRDYENSGAYGGIMSNLIPGFLSLSNNTPQKKLSNVTSVAVDCHSYMATTSNGDLYAWGFITQNSSPTVIMSNVKAISTCNGTFAVLKTDGSLYMWGNNTYGQIGDGTTTNIAEVSGAVKVLSNVASVCVGNGYTAAIKKDGSLYMWGDNSCGQLGDGTTTSSTKPKKIASDVLFVSLGSNHSAAIKNDGSLYMWGDNSYGQIGDGTTKTVKKPKKIMSNISMVSLGVTHSGAVTNGGQLYMWGDNTYGQLGDGTTTSSYIPKKVLSEVQSVELGLQYSAITKWDNALYMFGNNEKGIMGSSVASRGLILTPTKILSNIKKQPSTYLNPYSANSFYADTVIDATDDSTTDAGATEDVTPIAPTEKIAEFTGLLANEVYNFYVMKDRESELPFGADNLLYMTQAVSDADGNLSITYTPTAECDTADIFIKGMTRTDISTSHTISHDIVYNRAENLAVIDVLCNGEYLEEGLDYEITEGQVSKDIGTYTATIIGIGDYTGTLTTTYEVYCGHDYNTGKCIMCGHNKGDADANGEINTDDYNLMASAAALTTVIEDDVARCDMNGDGVVDGFDAIILDLRNNDMLRSTVTGDANGDGMVDDNDYTFLESVINGETAITDNVTRLCDLNSDGAITTDDLTMLESYLNGNLDWA